MSGSGDMENDKNIEIHSISTNCQIDKNLFHNRCDNKLSESLIDPITNCSLIVQNIKDFCDLEENLENCNYLSSPSALSGHKIHKFVKNFNQSAKNEISEIVPLNHENCENVVMLMNCNYNQQQKIPPNSNKVNTNNNTNYYSANNNQNLLNPNHNNSCCIISSSGCNTNNNNNNHNNNNKFNSNLIMRKSYTPSEPSNTSFSSVSVAGSIQVSVLLLLFWW